MHTPLKTVRQAHPASQADTGLLATQGHKPILHDCPVSGSTLSPSSPAQAQLQGCVTLGENVTVSSFSLEWVLLNGKKPPKEQETRLCG